MISSFAGRRLAISVVLLIPVAGRADPTADEKKWIEQVLLNGDAAKPCVRWTKTPRLSLFGATAAQAKLVSAVVDQFNETLVATPISKIELEKPEAADAEIKLHFAAIKDLPAAAKKYDFKYPKASKGVHWLWWNAKGELTQAVVLLSSDLKGDDLKKYLVKELAHSLGVNYESPLFADSAFNRLNGGDPAATTLSIQDRKLLVFLYNKIAPGTKLADVRAGFKSW